MNTDEIKDICVSILAQQVNNTMLVTDLANAIVDRGIKMLEDEFLLTVAILIREGVLERSKDKTGRNLVTLKDADKHKVTEITYLATERLRYIISEESTHSERDAIMGGLMLILELHETKYFEEKGDAILEAAKALLYKN